VISTVPVPGLHVADETSLAFGDGKAFLTHPGGAIDAVDLRTGAASVHRPRRSLSKGDAIVRARWLGGRLLGVGNAVVDVRTWHARVLDPAATGLAPAGDRLVAYGPRGVGVYTRAGRVLFRALRRVSVRDVHVVGRYLEAAEDSAADTVDLRTHRETRAAADPNLVWGMLAG
jgi:hypothetical protein